MESLRARYSLSFWDGLLIALKAGVRRLFVGPRLADAITAARPLAPVATGASLPSPLRTKRY
jgi:hypothetical protein